MHTRNLNRNAYTYTYTYTYTYKLGTVSGTTLQANLWSLSKGSSPLLRGGFFMHTRNLNRNAYTYTYQLGNDKMGY